MDKRMSPTEIPPEANLLDQVKTMRRAFWASPVSKRVVGLVAASIAVVVATAVGQVILNRWNKPFFDAIERRDLDTFFHQLVVFVEIAGVLLLLNITQTWLNQMVRLKLREGLTLDLIGEWMKPGRAFRVANAGAIGVNPDQRMQQDAQHLANLSTDLGFGLLQASILLVSFIGVLWSLSSGFVFHVAGTSFAIPGYMVWAAFIFAGSASCLSWLVGRSQININSERYAREADFRFSLMRVNEHVDAIAIAGGEAEEKRRLEVDVASILAVTRRIFGAQIRLAWVVDGYGWFMVVGPILVAAPVYFAGNISFGGLMMAVGAFTQVHSSLRWFINNIEVIADWRATLLRVADFRNALVSTDPEFDQDRHIEFSETSGDHLTFDALEMKCPTGSARLTEPHVTIRAGERVLITGEPGVGKTLLFRTIAGLLPWGSGRIDMPPRETVALVPRTPYVPTGKLRDVLSYPRFGAFTDTDLVGALTAVGLERLSAKLDREGRWDRTLSEDEQRLLAFARLRLLKPQWVIIDEALETMDRATLQRVLSLFENDLPKASVINLGSQQRAPRFFLRELRLVRSPQPKRDFGTPQGAHADAEVTPGQA